MLCLTLCDPWTASGQALLSSTVSQSLLKLMVGCSARADTEGLCCYRGSGRVCVLVTVSSNTLQPPHSPRDARLPVHGVEKSQM